MENQKYSQDNINIFWSGFLNETNRIKTTKYLDIYHFELTEKLANELLHLVLIGQKKATSSSLWAYKIEGVDIPKIGDLNIITDWEGVPRCIIETIGVTVIPLSDMTYDICKREGEDDTLASWYINHNRFFMEEAKELGYEFNEEMLVVFEDFDVVYQI